MEVITGLPVCASTAFRATPVALPPRFATSRFASKVFGFSFVTIQSPLSRHFFITKTFINQGKTLKNSRFLDGFGGYTVTPHHFSFLIVSY
ncbi:MAG: hypothetical protein LBQ98_07980 [Nitrososphaerota archaeon]|nr:hypothetical protein [Nitrososphaerota archaeon]